jgi:MFS superfamily sulfate permease-like transporter
MGMICEIIINIINGKPLSVIFKAPTEVSFDGNKYLIEIDQAAVFTNFMGIKRKLDAIPSGFDVTIDLSKTKLIDHSTMENLHTYKKEYQLNGGTVELIGLNEHIAISDHQSATRIKK